MLVNEIVKKDRYSNIFLELFQSFQKKYSSSAHQRLLLYRIMINIPKGNGEKEIYRFQAMSGYDNRLH